MRRPWLAVLAMGIVVVLVTSCGPRAVSLTPDEVIAAFQAAGLEAEDARPMTPEDYGIAPMVATSASRFLIPSICEDCGGRVFAFSNQEDLEKTATFYEDMGRESAIFYYWVFRNENILVQINGDLPEEQARQYEAALLALGTN